MTPYVYLNVPWTGYHFNAKTKIQATIPNLTVSFSWSTRPEYAADHVDLTVQCSRELTPTEETTLAALVAADATVIPTNTGTTLYIKDFWEYREWIKQETGETFEIYYSKTGSLSDPNSMTDTIELHFPDTMTNNRKKAFKDLFALIIKETPGD